METEIKKQNISKPFVMSTGLFWQKSLWNGRKAVPVVLVLSDRKLSMYDKEGVEVFNVNVGDIHVNFGNFLNRYMRIVIGSTTYKLSAIGTPISPNFTDLQKKLIKNPNKASELLNQSFSDFEVSTISQSSETSPSAGDIEFGVEAVISATMAMNNNDKQINRWRKTFINLGVDVKGSEKHFFRMMYIIPVAIMLVLLVYIFLIKG